MKTKKSLIYLFLLLTFISCKKDVKTNSEIKNIDFDTKTALSSYKNFKSYSLNAVKDGIVKSSNASSVFSAKTDFTILENVFYESSTKEYSFVEFQIEYKFKNGLLPNKANDATDKARMDATIDRLLVKKNKKSGIIDYELISYIPDKEALTNKLTLKENKHSSLLTDFSGHVYHKNIGGETLYLEVIKNGLVSKKLYKAKNSNGLKVQGSNKENYEYCETYCIEGYVYDPSCYCYVVGYECFTDCYEVTNYPGVTIDNGMLSFDSNQDLQNLLIQLENDYEAHNGNFFDTRDYMTDDEINDYSDAIGFDEFKPLRDFENYFGFASLRQTIEAQTISWMDQTVEASACYNPANTTTIDDETEQSVYNQNGQIKIAGITYTIEITANNPCPGNSRCIPNGSSSCFDSGRRAVEEEFDSNKIAYKIIKLDGHGWPLASDQSLFAHKPRVKGKVITFKLKNNGGKRRFAMKISARVFGNAYDQGSDFNCNFRESFDTDHNPVRRRYRRKNKQKFESFTYSKYCEMTAEFKINSNTYIQYLN